MWILGPAYSGCTVEGDWKKGTRDISTVLRLLGNLSQNKNEPVCVYCWFCALGNSDSNLSTHAYVEKITHTFHTFYNSGFPVLNKPSCLVTLLGNIYPSYFCFLSSLALLQMNLIYVLSCCLWKFVKPSRCIWRSSLKTQKLTDVFCKLQEKKESCFHREALCPFPSSPVLFVQINSEAGSV